MQKTATSLKLRCSIAVFSILCLWPSAAFSQIRHVEVVDQTKRELERTARHLNTTPDQLRETRRLLREATDLVLSEDLDPTWRLNGLLGLWRRAHPTEAIATMEAVLDKLRATAANTGDPAAYGWALTAARSVAGEVLAWGPRTEEYLAEWPQRPELGDQASAHLAQAQSEAERARWFESALQDPLATARSILTGNGPDSLALATQLAGQLRYQGEPDIAAELIESMLDRLRNGQYTDQSAVWNFADQVSRLFPDHFAEALEILHSLPLTDSPNSGFREILLRNDRGEALLTPEETRLMRLLQASSHNPELLDEAMRRFPDLNAKLAKLGGLQKAFRAEVTTWDKNGETRTWDPTRYERERFRYRWGDATLDPADTRRRLRAAFADERDLPMFFNLVWQNCAEDPDFSRIALGLLHDRVFHEKAESKTGNLAQFVKIVHRCEGRVDTALLEKGFEELDAFRKASPAHEDSSNPYAPRGAERLEEALFAALSGADLEEALKRVRAINPPSARFRMLVAMIQSRLGQY